MWHIFKKYLPPVSYLLFNRHYLIHIYLINIYYTFVLLHFKIYIFIKNKVQYFTLLSQIQLSLIS